MNIRLLAAALVVATAAAVVAVSWGLLDEWGDAQLVGALVAGAVMVALATSIAGLAARRALRLMTSTHKYARLASERTAAMRPQISAFSGSLQALARSSGRRVRESGSPLEESSGVGVSRSADRHRRSGDHHGPTMVVALGSVADDPGLHDLLRSGERGDVLLVTDRADLVPRFARVAVVEYVQLPPKDARPPVAWLATRLVELAAEHGAAALVEWPHAHRVSRVGGDGMEALSVVREEVLRDLFELESGGSGVIEELVERTAREAERRQRTLVDELTKVTGRLQHAVETLDRRSEKRQAAAVRELRSELNDVYRQLESLTALYRMFDGSPTLPHLRGWAVSPDLAIDLLDLVLSGRARSILELGSGASTVLFAMALERAGVGHVTSLDHDESYATQTQELLEEYGVAHRATVVHAPLVTQAVDGEEFSWYRLDDVELPDEVDLLFVDGPPEATGPRSRYPALPLLETRLAAEAIIVLDDGRRPDEQAIAEAWSERDGISSLTALPHERRPLLLSYRRPDGS